MGGSGGPPDGHVVTVFSAKGGSGKTVLSVNLAAALADGGRRQVCLVDLDLAFGDVGICLQVFPAHTIADALPLAEVLDEVMVAGLLTPHSPGLSLLVAPLDRSQSEQISPLLVDDVIGLLRVQFDVVVVDTPPAFTDHVLAAIDRSDLVLLVATPDQLSLRSLALTMETLDLGAHPAERRQVLLNRARGEHEPGPAGGSRPVVEPVALVPDSRDVPGSVNRGVPLVLDDPDHQVSRVLVELAERTAGWLADHSLRRPDGGPELTAAQRLEAYARAAASTHGLSAAVHVHPETTTMPPDPDVVRVGCEAVAIAVRHPGARNLWVDIVLGASPRVRVEDDGTGPLARHETSRGFRALHELAGDCGVELRVVARDGGGTVIEVGGPMPHEAVS